LEVKQPECEADRLLPSYAKVKNEWNCVSIPTYAFMALTRITAPYITHETGIVYEIVVWKLCRKRPFESPEWEHKVARM
jgi:hypothetical protein